MSSDDLRLHSRYLHHMGSALGNGSRLSRLCRYVSDILIIRLSLITIYRRPRTQAFYTSPLRVGITPTCFPVSLDTLTLPPSHGYGCTPNGVVHYPHRVYVMVQRWQRSPSSLD